MKIVQFLGGLGNQMFQYAFYLNLCQKFNYVKADLSEYNKFQQHNGYELKHIFSINLPIANKLESSLLNPQNKKRIWRILRKLARTKRAHLYDHPEFGFHNRFFDDTSSRYYTGYWQNIEYIKRVEENLRKDFQFPPIKDSKNKELFKTLQQNNTIAVHVRRGDYLGHGLLGNICDLAYYNQAIEYIKNNVDNPLFIFFSNDITWCRSEFGSLHSLFVDWNHGKDNYIDMQMMSLCKHQIIANSSFSWWAAWLNSYRNKIVICPKTWTNDKNIDTSGLILKNFITF